MTLTPVFFHWSSGAEVGGSADETIFTFDKVCGKCLEGTVILRKCVCFKLTSHHMFLYE